MGWWLLYRRLQTVYVVSLPFCFYALAFFLIGMSPFGPGSSGKAWLQMVATGFYALASSSGALFFAVNFADEGMKVSTNMDPVSRLTSHRRCACHYICLSSVCCSGYAADLCCCAVVLVSTSQSHFIWTGNSILGSQGSPRE